MVDRNTAVGSAAAPRSHPVTLDLTVGRLALDTLATAPASRLQRRLAALLCVVAVVATAMLIPAAGLQMPTMPGFLVLNQSALVLVYGFTTWLLLVQYRRTGAVPLLVLSAGSLCTTAAVTLQLVCFPNVFGPGVLIGQGAATLTWLWNIWHLCPPLFALIYALVERSGRLPVTQPGQVKAVAVGTAASMIAVMAVLGFVVCRYTSVLPRMVDADGGYWAITTSGVGPALIVLNIGALVALCWATRLRNVLQLWVAVALVLLLLDNVITDLGAIRGSVGWFVGRIEALLAGLVVLGVYIQEVDHLYGRAELAAASREQARAEAQSARDSLDIALEASCMGDWQFDLATGHVGRTLRHDRLFGYEALRPNWTAATFIEHVHPEDRPVAQAAFDAAMQTGRLELECRIQRADTGAVRWLAVYGRTSHDRAGRSIGMAGCLLDVTDRHLTDERLRQAERMEAVGQLTGGVAHDFNNLLTVILGNLELIMRRPGDPARVERLAKVALTAGRRGTDLTDKLLSFSRRQMVQPETVNLNRLIADFRPLLQQAVGATVEVSLDLDPGLDPVRLDQNQFQAVLLNLAGNARDAMPSGGTLRVHTSNVKVGPDLAPDMPELVPGNYLLTIISDTGIGMDEAMAARAFEPFFTTKEVGKGTGLGLSQVYGFVRQSGGHCRLRTAPGQGFALEIFLPRVSDTVREETLPSNVVPIRPAAHGEVVLIVEDEQAVREMAAESLEGLGYKVVTAPDARIAMDVLRGPSRVDVLFSDVVMPGGMNGAQLAMQAREIRGGLKVLLTSGYMATATGGSRDLPEGVPLLRKPYMREDLAAKLQMVMSA
jgi:signal transduction histidine kinase/CheY-like chemotaxis protein